MTRLSQQKSGASPPASEPSLIDNIERLGIYQVYTGLGTGSGFLIDAEHLLTNCHVVAPYREVAVELRDRSRIVGRVCRLHPHRDLAIVKLARPVPGEVLRLSETATLRPKQAVHILGFPVGLPLSLTEGVISHARQLLDEQYFLQTDAAINPGNSGGPMLDDAREIIAVTTCKLTQADAVGFGIPVADVRQFIEEFRAQTHAFGVQCPACAELIAVQVRYCPSCGTDLEARHDFDEYFAEPELDPLVNFVETALTQAQINPILARHGSHNWSFHSGNAPVKVWCCCSEHLNFSSAIAQTPARGLNTLFQYLLDATHTPYSFDLNGSTIRMNHVVHISDIFAEGGDEELKLRVKSYVEKATATDTLLIDTMGCTPGTESLRTNASDFNPITGMPSS
jgi:serine protease Do